MKKYRMRAECVKDALVFCSKCPEGVLKEIVCDLWPGLPDLEITFETELSISALKYICSGIEDGHVMLETIQLYEDYTGNRS